VTAVGGLRISDSRYRSLSGSILSFKTFYSIAHYGAGRVFDTVAHIADALRAIVEDSGLFEALDVRAIY